LLQAQKELVIYDFGQLKQELKPAATAFNFLGKIVTRERNNLLVNEVPINSSTLYLKN
jgi:hypothetical protein